jgi:3-hydroxyisobutyrate dehydrogenase
MARNLQSKLSPSDKVSIFDVNPQAMEGLKAEMAAVPQGAVAELAASAFDASKDAVSVPLMFLPRCFWQCLFVMSTIVLSMI